MSRFSNVPEVFSLQDEEDFFGNIWDGIQKAGNNIAGGLINEGDKWVQDQIGIAPSPANPAGNTNGMPVYNDPAVAGPNPFGQNSPVPNPAPMPMAKETPFGMDAELMKYAPAAIGAAGSAVAKYGFKQSWMTSLLIGAGTGVASHFALKQI